MLTVVLNARNRIREHLQPISINRIAFSLRPSRTVPANGSEGEPERRHAFHHSRSKVGPMGTSRLIETHPDFLLYKRLLVPNPFRKLMMPPPPSLTNGLTHSAFAPSVRRGKG